MTQPTTERAGTPVPTEPRPPAEDAVRRPRWRRAAEVALGGATAGVPF